MKSLSGRDVKRILDSGEEVILLDVRTKEEYERSKLRLAKNLPYEEIEDRITNLVPDKKSKIIVYCLSGSRSQVACQTLEELGYTDIVNLENGLLSWRANGFSLE